MRYLIERHIKEILRVHPIIKPFGGHDFMRRDKEKNKKATNRSVRKQGIVV